MITTAIQGMGGLGDCLHARALIRALPKEDRLYWLSTPWPSVFHDLVGDHVKLMPLDTRLRTQRKNMNREQGGYSRGLPGKATRNARIRYTPEAVLERGSVLYGMRASSDLPESKFDGDFRLPVPRAWVDKAYRWLDQWQPDKPLMIYRPLNERSEWAGCPARNPDHDAYVALAASIRADYFVVSVADFERGKEWQVGPDLSADVECHRGELDFQTLAALVSMSSLVYSSPGFAVVLAQAVGTPSVAVFGGYEDGRSFSGGAKWAPHLAIEPLRPCACFQHDCPCDKEIDLAIEGRSLKAFAALNLRPLPLRPIFGGRPAGRPTVPVQPARCDLSGLPTAYMNPGELERLIALVDSVSPRVMVEVGCNSGRTAKAILRNVDTLERYVGIDVPPSYKFAARVQAREVPPNPGALALDDPRFRLILARRGTFDLTPDDLPRCDVVFIDGDHGAEAVRHDHALALQMVRPGGLIIHHDDHDLGNVDVRAVLDDLSTPAAPIAHVEGTWLAVYRVPAEAGALARA